MYVIDVFCDFVYVWDFKYLFLMWLKRLLFVIICYFLFFLKIFLYKLECVRVIVVMLNYIDVYNWYDVIYVLYYIKCLLFDWYIVLL